VREVGANIFPYNLVTLVLVLVIASAIRVKSSGADPDPVKNPQSKEFKLRV
jgi:hypothetical protein